MCSIKAAAIFFGFLFMLLLGATIYGGTSMYMVSISSMQEVLVTTAHAEIVAAFQAVKQTLDAREDVAKALRTMIKTAPTNFTHYPKWLQNVAEGLVTNRNGIGLDVTLGVKPNSAFGPPEMYNYYYGIAPTPAGSTPGINEEMVVHRSEPGQPFNVSTCFRDRWGQLGNCSHWQLASQRYNPVPRLTTRWRGVAVHVWDTPDGPRPFWWGGYDLIMPQSDFVGDLGFVDSMWIMTSVQYDRWGTILQQQRLSGTIYIVEAITQIVVSSSDPKFVHQGDLQCIQNVIQSNKLKEVAAVCHPGITYEGPVLRDAFFHVQGTSEVDLQLVSLGGQPHFLAMQELVSLDAAEPLAGPAQEPMQLIVLWLMPASAVQGDLWRSGALMLVVIAVPTLALLLFWLGSLYLQVCSGASLWMATVPLFAVNAPPVPKPEPAWQGEWNAYCTDCDGWNCPLLLAKRAVSVVDCSFRVSSSL